MGYRGKIYWYKLLCTIRDKNGIAKVRLLNEKATYRTVSYEEMIVNVEKGKWHIENIASIDDEHLNMFPAIYPGGLISTIPSIVIIGALSDEIVAVTAGGTIKSVPYEVAEELKKTGQAYDPEEVLD